MRSIFIAVPLILALGSSSRADTKRAGEPCTQDSECKGHCYTKKNNDKVCVNCDSSTISEARRELEKLKEQPKPCPECQGDAEQREDTYKNSINMFKQLIDWRTKENERCWDGGDQGHRDAVSQAKNGQSSCEDKLSACKDKGMIYTCSESTFSSKSADVDSACNNSDDMDRSCEGWSKDIVKVDCRAIEEVRGKADKCKSAVDSLKSSCLDRFSRRRERQRDKADKGYYGCNELLKYKESNSACK